MDKMSRMGNFGSTCEPEHGTRVTALPNAGIFIAGRNFSIAFDPVFDPIPGISTQHPHPSTLPEPQLILVTHDHWDHMSQNSILSITGPDTVVAGPGSVIRKLAKHIPADRLVRFRGAEAGMQDPEEYSGIPGFTVKAIATTHSSKTHLSYLVETASGAFYHDGDNERTDPLMRLEFPHVKALFLCPWQGSGWEDFVEFLAPGQWFLIHLDNQEIIMHRQGLFLDSITSRRIPGQPAVALAPGEYLTI